MTEETTAAEEPQEKPIYGNVSIEELEKPEYDEDQVNEFMALYEESISGIKEGQIVKGTVVSIGPSEVMVDIGFKSEGAVSIKEFSDPSAIEINQEVEVFLENVEDQEGQVVLSKQKADFMRVWDSIKDAHDTGNTVEGRLMRRIKGGIVVDLFGVEAFLPGSQIDIRQVKNFDQFIGQEFPFKIIKLNKARRNIVVSRRAVLEEERGRMREEIIKVLEEGQVREGVVKNITDFGAFIDLGGVDGLLHITDMSWGRVNHPSELVSIGDRIKVKVLNYDRERERISLGLKQLTTHPWENIEDKYPIDGQIRGKVVSITDYGAFVELEEGIEGLVHISEMSWTQHVRHPSKLVNIGDSVEVMVLKVDSENQKISLGMKQTEEDPWETLDSKYPPGTKLEGTVRSLTNFGAFVEIEDNIDGLVHISDMSWTKRIRQASEMFKKGDEIPVTVTEIDIKRRRISLSHKMAFENPWPGFGEQYAVGTEVKGAISRILERGVVVSLIDEVDGFVPLSQLAIDGLKNPRQSFEDGQELPLKVIEFDQDQKKIVLSAREYFKDKDQADYEGYLADHPIKEVEPVEEAVADKDDEMESWGDAHDGGAPPAESAPVENDAADEDDDE
ncbi:MAG: 30S ribosomal protein S1 [Gemmatimonadetes bacterium]|jgi:small subunit ribosomal protein S1|nr:30S ribosomal protein S1 [Gemmatimonadota bacterium]MDE0964470.1 30S ribosomal protein S1 [Candidatus Latescibacterota bacterium]MBT5326473.1 30S ribosomal protein S1 [Gemmatimonadota bacterium]MBT5449266.1 30S ribosomal protein S1 [Gemmatimonadota bacterium]MBT6623625.1 30S ribosomal protein S1 [Gemmatimonadota bacterium]|tara:strand:- start:176 stop:2023 length:1848 start_codon:yes stop_codon:yes gene_type:complete